MRRLVWLLGLLIKPTTVFAAVLNVAVAATSPPAASITCPIQYPSGSASFVSPIPAGTPICTITVSPSTWTGAVWLGGTNGTDFALNGSTVVVGPNGYSLPVGTGSITLHFNITASP